MNKLNKLNKLQNLQNKLKFSLSCFVFKDFFSLNTITPQNECASTVYMVAYCRFSVLFKSFNPSNTAEGLFLFDASNIVAHW